MFGQWNVVEFIRSALNIEDHYVDGYITQQNRYTSYSNRYKTGSQQPKQTLPRHSMTFRDTDFLFVSIDANSLVVIINISIHQSYVNQ